MNFHDAMKKRTARPVKYPFVVDSGKSWWFTWAVSEQALVDELVEAGLTNFTVEPS